VRGTPAAGETTIGYDQFHCSPPGVQAILVLVTAAREPGGIVIVIVIVFVPVVAIEYAERRKRPLSAA
jgi:hypothetical protein